MASATSRGRRPARFARASATFVAKSPCSFCLGARSSGSGTSVGLQPEAGRGHGLSDERRRAAPRSRAPASAPSPRELSARRREQRAHELHQLHGVERLRDVRHRCRARGLPAPGRRPASAPRGTRPASCRSAGCSRRRRQTSYPSRPGIITSRTTASGPVAAARSSASRRARPSRPCSRPAGSSPPAGGR